MSHAELSDAIRKGLVVPFIGAGVSMAASADLPADLRFPSWTRLLERLLERVPEEHQPPIRTLITSGQLVPAAEEVRKRLSKHSFIEALSGILLDLDVPPDGVDLALPKMLLRIASPVAICTNYDRVLEWAGARRWFVNDDAYELIASDTRTTPVVWHLHGHIQRPESIILAESQYRQLYRRNNLAKLRLVNLIGSRSLLFVGMALTDPFVLQTLRNVVKLAQGFGRTHYIVLRAQESAKLPADLNVQPLVVSGHGQPVLELLESIAPPSTTRNAPTAINTRYVDRPRLANAINRALGRRAGGSRRRRIVTLVGLSGIGKTELARQRARALPAGGAVIWISAESQASIQSSVEAEAARIGVGAPVGKTLDEWLRALAATLAGPSALVVLDGATDAEWVAQASRRDLRDDDVGAVGSL